MKKLSIFMVLILLVSALLVSCGNASGDEDPLYFLKDSIEVNFKYDDFTMTMENVRFDNPVYSVDDAAAKIILDTLNEGEWESGYYKLVYDYVIVIEYEKTTYRINYTVFNGCFNDRANNRHYELSPEDRDYINSVIDGIVNK